MDRHRPVDVKLSAVLIHYTEGSIGVRCKVSGTMSISSSKEVNPQIAVACCNAAFRLRARSDRSAARAVSMVSHAVVIVVEFYDILIYYLNAANKD